MKPRKAFTIIEVVLVLAIAGLIFLMVFVALPALQRSQRNTRRRQDIARIATAVNNYQSNNNRLPFPATGPGKLNGVDKNFVGKYIDSNCTVKTKGSVENHTYYNGSQVKLNGYYECNSADQFIDPDGTAYNLYSPGDLAESETTVFNKGEGVAPSFEENHHYIIALSHAQCSTTENTAIKGSGANNYAILYLLEGGSVYCVDNQ